MRKLAAVGFTQLAEVGFGIDSAHAHERFEPVGLVEMGALADRGELQVVDVREASEQSEMATGAIAVPYRLLAEADLSALDPEKPTAVVCHTGARYAARGLAAGAPRVHARAAGAGRGHGRLGCARSGGGRSRAREVGGSRVRQGQGARRRRSKPGLSAPRRPQPSPSSR